MDASSPVKEADLKPRMNTNTKLCRRRRDRLGRPVCDASNGPGDRFRAGGRTQVLVPATRRAGRRAVRVANAPAAASIGWRWTRTAACLGRGRVELDQPSHNPSNSIQCVALRHGCRESSAQFARSRGWRWHPPPHAPNQPHLHMPQHRTTWLIGQRHEPVAKLLLLRQSRSIAI